MIFFFLVQKIITRYRRIGENLNVIRQSACLVFNPILVGNYAAFFSGSGVRLYDGPDIKLYFCCGSNCFVFWSRIFVLFEPYVRFHIFSSVRVTEWPPIAE